MTGYIAIRKWPIIINAQLVDQIWINMNFLISFLWWWHRANITQSNCPWTWRAILLTSCKQIHVIKLENAPQARHKNKMYNENELKILIWCNKKFIEYKLMARNYCWVGTWSNGVICVLLYKSTICCLLITAFLALFINKFLIVNIIMRPLKNILFNFFFLHYSMRKQFLK